MFVVCYSLGATHDGQNGCADSDYIMAPSSSAQVGASAYNPWLFSTCSIDEIRNKINDLSK